MVWINKILDILLPKECLGCGIEKTFLCPKCIEKMPWPDEGQNNRIPAAVSYQNPLAKKCIKTLKYRGVKKMAEPLAEILCERLLSGPHSLECHEYLKNPNSLIIPIPLSKKRLKQRGFNQAELLAHSISDKLNLRVLYNVLYRTRHTEPQADIKDREARLKNMVGVFSVKNPELVDNQVVIVVDDVSTTGATLNDARRALLEAGAKKVIGISIAK